MNEVVNVGIAEIKIAQSPVRLKTAGLGSCVGVILYEDNKNIAGLAHVMLPDSALSKQQELNPGKFADTAPVTLTQRLNEFGLIQHRIKAKIAGGAQMFQFTGSNQMMRIGPRNIEAVKNTLRNLGIEIVAEDVGGNCGRTIEFNIETKELQIKTVYKGTTVI
jgi:chemotaxis protein CheD